MFFPFHLLLFVWVYIFCLVLSKILWNSENINQIVVRIIELKHDNFVYDDDGIYKIEQSPLDKKFRVYENGQLRKECGTYEECVAFLGDNFTIKGEFGDNCVKWYNGAVEDIKNLGQFHSLPLVFAELEKEVGVEVS